LVRYYHKKPIKRYPKT